MARLLADRHRFEEGVNLLYAYRGILISWLFPRLGRNAEDCADVAQEVFISVAKQCPFKRNAFSKALFFTIAERRVADFQRRRLALKRRAQENAVPLDDAGDIVSQESVTANVIVMEHIQHTLNS